MNEEYGTTWKTDRVYLLNYDAFDELYVMGNMDLIPVVYDPMGVIY